MNEQALRVLIAIDGSEPAWVAVQLAENITWPPGTTILVAEAIPTGAGLFGGPWPALGMVQADRIEAELSDDAHRTVEEAHHRLSRPGLNVESAVLRGRAASMIVDRASAMAADLVIVGSRGHGAIESMLVGSVSAEVVDHAPAPVLVARGERIKRVVLAWDGSSCAEKAADLIRRWPIFNGATLRVVGVAAVTTPWWAGFPAGAAELTPLYVESAQVVREEHEVMARDMTAQLQKAGFTAEAEVRDGDAATQIIVAATAWQADLIVMGTHGRTGLTRLMLGSVARNVLHHAECSVLVVREQSSSPAAATS